jgi:hypothetical protein
MKRQKAWLLKAGWYHRNRGSSIEAMLFYLLKTGDNYEVPEKQPPPSH